MRGIAAALLVLACTGSLAAADEYSCRSLAGDPAAEAAFSLGYSSGAYAITTARFQIEGDIGYSTTAPDPRDVATVTGVDASDREIRFDFHYADAGYDGDVATLHVVTLSEGAQALTAGVLHVVAGGLWPVQCSVDHEG